MKRILFSKNSVRITIMAVCLLAAGTSNPILGQTYCTSGFYAYDCLYSAIDHFSMANLNQASTGCAGEYADYTSTVVQVAQGEAYPFIATSNWLYSQYLGIWVDFNDNGSFDDAGEFLFTSPEANKLTGEIVIPADAGTGNHRMRVRIKGDWAGGFSATEACTLLYANGEVHDYTLQVNTAPACTGIYGLTVSGITKTSAALAWNCISCSGAYIIEYGPEGFTPGTATAAGTGGTVMELSAYTGGTVALSGLAPSRSYHVYVRRNCGAEGFSTNYGPVALKTLWDACATLTTITCGTPIVAVIPAGLGEFASDCTYGDGKELVYAFSPNLNGKYTFTVTAADGQVGYALKYAADGCDASGWKCVGDVFNYQGTFLLGDLEAGKTYYFMLDARYADQGGKRTFRIDCYEPQAPCENIVALTCGIPAEMVIAPGAGIFDEVEGMRTYDGREKVFSFIPPKTGAYTITHYPTTDPYYMSAGYSFKKASEGCSASGWHFINGYINQGTTIDLIGTLIGGQEYYLLADAASLAGASGNFQIDCYEPGNPCENIQDIVCGVPTEITLPAGIGNWLPEACYNNPNSVMMGKEKIFRFVPAASGYTDMYIVSGIGSYPAQLFLKEADSGCSPEGWQCIGWAQSGGAIRTPYPLVAGKAYYLLADAADYVGHTFTVQIVCHDDAIICNAITPISCNAEVTASIPAGLGQFLVQQSDYPYPGSPYGGYGKEVIFSFTPTVSGSHFIEVISTNYTWVKYYLKDAADGCNATGWKILGSVYQPPNPWETPPLLPYPLIAGQTYYLMLDASYLADAPVHTFKIVCPEPSDPCAAITAINCETPYTFTNPPGLGQLSPHPYYMGRETIYSFTPAITGTYLLEVLSTSNYNPVIYQIKEAADGCNNNHWTNINATGGPGILPIPITLVAGRSYFLIADGTRDGSSQTFRITCPTQAQNPCGTITNIAGCGIPISVNIAAGLGIFTNPSDNPAYYSPFQGRERIYTFTAPVSGVYGLSIEDGGSGSFGYFIKNASEGCQESGWAYIAGNSYGTGFITQIGIPLSAGATYYLLADALNTNGGSQIISIICPAGADPCANPTVITNCGGENPTHATLPEGLGRYILKACNYYDRPIQGGGSVFLFTPATTYTYSFNVSNYYNPGNLHLFLKNASLECASENWICMRNDGYGYYTPFPLEANTTYQILAALMYPESTETSMDLTVSCAGTQITYPDSDFDGYGDGTRPDYGLYVPPKFGYVFEAGDCNDANSTIHPGAAEVCGNQIDDDCDGQTDEDCHCLMTVNAGADATSQYGYGPTETISRTITVDGGTAPYTYTWTLNRPVLCNNVNAEGDEFFASGSCTNTVCPGTGGLTIAPVCYGTNTITAKLITSAIVCVTVTDALGCVASDCFEINPSDVRCYSKDMLSAKVQLCHKTGKKNPAWSTICVDASTVAGHLAHGDKLGGCATNQDTEISITAKLTTPPSDAGLIIKAWPNPSSGMFTLNISSNSNETATVKVYDVLGKALHMASGAANANYHFGANFSSGLYFVEVKQGTARAMVKLIKQ